MNLLGCLNLRPASPEIIEQNVLLSQSGKAKKKILPVSCNGQKKNRIGRSVKKNLFALFFCQKCVFYACFTLIGSWGGRKNFRVGIFLNKNLLG